MPKAGNIVHEQNVLIKTFRDLGATDAERAISTADLQVRKPGSIKGQVLAKFLDLGIANTTESGLYYLDDDKAQGLLDHRGVIHFWRMSAR